MPSIISCRPIPTHPQPSSNAHVGGCPGPRAASVCHFAVVQATDLMAMDVGLFNAATSDPYVRVKIADQTWRTPTVRRTCSPVWPEGTSYDFLVFSPAQHVHVQVFDEDRASADDALGCVGPLPVSDLLRHAGLGPVLLPLQDQASSTARLGLQLEWLVPQRAPPPGPEGPGCADLYLLEFIVKEVPSAVLCGPLGWGLSGGGGESEGVRGGRSWPPRSRGGGSVHMAPVVRR